MKAKYLLATLLALGTLAATAGEAQAQYYGYGYAPRPVYARPGFNREGLTIGFAVGGGVVKPDNVDVTGGGWLSFRIGGMLTRNFRRGGSDDDSSALPPPSAATETTPVSETIRQSS